MRKSSKKKERVSREELLAAIREAAPSAGDEWDKRKRGLGLRTFIAKSGLRMCDIQRHFVSWNDALKAAGGDVATHLTSLTPEKLLEDWGLVTRKLQRPPPCLHYNFHGKYSGITLTKRFGGWRHVREAFREFAKGKEEWADVVMMLEKGRRDEGGGRKEGQAKVAASRPCEDRPVYGEPLGPPGLRNAPTNENGVILVFGMLAAQLGFHIQAVRTAFPDCDALRQMGSAGWQNVTIEFEFQSSNFHQHGHPPNGCDIIVCWNHNWAECPANLEVIALRDVIAKRELATE